MDSSDQIGRITPAGVTVEFPIPNFPGADSSWYGGMTTGPDGNLWFAISSLNPAYPGRIGRITPAGDVTEFATHSEPNQITVGPDGNLWFTADFAIGRITPAGVVTEFPLPVVDFSGPESITAGPDGNLWFTLPGFDKIGRIGRITPAGQIVSFSVPFLTVGRGPYGITAGPDGNLWFTQADRIGRMSPAGAVTLSIPTGFRENDPITVGPDGNLWFTQLAGADQIGRITTGGVITEYAVPVAQRPVRAITKGPDGNLWFTQPLVSLVGRLNLQGTAQSWLDRVYQDLLNRPGDPAGEAAWTNLLNHGASRQTVVTMIEQSAEYRSDEVGKLYQQLLHRNADAQGLNAFVNALGSGATILQVEAAMAGSPEFFQNAGGSNQGFVTALYSNLLHRAPDPGGQAMALVALNGGVSRQAVAGAVLSSPEFYADLVTSLYIQFLQRAPDSFGFNLSVQALGNGFSEEGLVAVLLGSDEYFASITD
jgi:streptogramin lyase